MKPSPKLTEGLMRSLAHAPGQKAPLSVIVRYGSPARIMRHPTPMPGARASYYYRLMPFVHMHATPDAIRSLVADPGIVRIYEDLPVHAYVDVSVPRIQAPRLWEVGLRGDGLRIAVVDTGIDPDHPDFSGRIINTMDITGEGVRDRNGHGTHCAGVVAGSGAASGGQYRGVAPAAELYIAKVLRSDGQGMMSDVMAGIEWASEQDVQVISLSLGGGGPGDGTDALSEMCDAATRSGIIVCVAAGNEGPGPYTIGSPGCSRTAITIGAVDDADRMASFSSRGPTSDGRIKPDVVLPGVDIVAPRAQGTSMGAPVNEYYTCCSGTSMATPHAAGVCALLLQAFPNSTPAEIKTRLLDAAVDLHAEPNAQGRGRVDAWRAWRQNGGQPGTPEPDDPPATGRGCLLGPLNALRRKG